MAIEIKFGLRARCSEENLLVRLNRLRNKLLSLPLQRVSPIIRIAPVYGEDVFWMMEDLHLPIPPEVARIKDAERPPDHDEHSTWMSLCPVAEVTSKKFADEFFRPAVEMLDHPPCWNENDYPEQTVLPWRHINRSRGYLTEFVNVLLRYGYVIEVDLKEGSSPIHVALSAYRTAADIQAWAGWGTCKTYSPTNFKQAHELTCDVLDAVKEQGLLGRARDDCKYYRTRNWEESMKIVREELFDQWAFAATLKRALEQGGTSGITVESPALDYVDPLDGDQRMEN